MDAFFDPFFPLAMALVTVAIVVTLVVLVHWAGKR